MIRVASCSGLLGRGVPTHPPRRLPHHETVAILLRAAVLPVRRRRCQATLHAQLHLGNLFMAALCGPHLVAAGATETWGYAEHIVRKKLASARCGCAHLRGFTSPILGAEAAQTLAARASIGLAATLMMYGMEPTSLGTERLGHAALAANQFEGAHSRLGRGGSATALQRAQFVGAPARLGMRGLEAAGRRHWRGTLLISTKSEPQSERGFMTKSTSAPSLPPRRGLRRFARGSWRAPTAQPLGKS